MKKIFIDLSKKGTVLITFSILLFYAILSSSCNCDSTQCGLSIEYLFPDDVVEYSPPCEAYLTIYNTFWSSQNPYHVIDITPPSLINYQVYSLSTCHGKGKIKAIMTFWCSEQGPNGRPPKIRAQYESGWVVKPKLDCDKTTQFITLNMYETVNQACN